MANLNEINSLSGSQVGGQFSQIGQTKETPVTRLSGALERLHKAEAQVASVTAKLVGEPAVDGACREASKPIGSGIFGNIEEMADGVAALAADIIDHATRIERRL